MVFSILGYRPGEITPSIEVFNSLVHPNDIQAVRKSEEEAQKSGIHSVQHRMYTNSGKMIWVHELAELQSDGVTLIGTVRDITEQKQLELQLQEQAVVDPLTHAGNRRYFRQALSREYHRFERYGSALCMIMFDLDHFKRINDTYGHATGDQILVAVAEAVKGSLRQQDIFSRIGGEEFAVLLPGLKIEDAKTVAEKLRAAIANVQVVDNGARVSVTATLGLVALSEDIESEEHLQQIADRALYRGKKEGRNRVIVADRSLY